MILQAVRLSGRSHFDTLKARCLDRALNYTRGLGLLDEVADVSQPIGPALRHHCGKTHGSETIVEHPRPWQLKYIGEQGWTRRRARVSGSSAQKVERSGLRLSPDQLRPL
jgi:hypothetical protein